MERFINELKNLNVSCLFSSVSLNVYVNVNVYCIPFLVCRRLGVSRVRGENNRVLEKRFVAKYGVLKVWCVKKGCVTVG